MSKRTCQIDGCEKTIRALGWCTAHLRRFYRYGDPLGEPAPPPSIEERFWAKVDKHGPVPEHRPDLGPCWLWMAMRAGRGENRYGKFRYPGGQLAHRYAFELLVGPIPADLQPDHLCRNPGCVNPGHLELVTQRENCLRGESFSATNARKTRCPLGHPLKGDNLYVYPDGRRSCRECARVASREYQRKRRARLRAQGG